VWRRRKEEKRKSFGRGEHQPSRSIRPSPGRPGRGEVVYALFRREALQRLADRRQRFDRARRDAP